MSERPTLLSRGIKAPIVQAAQSGAPSGAFGDFSGAAALGRSVANTGAQVLDTAAAQAAQAREHLRRMREEHERRTSNDYALQHSNAITAAAMGVSAEFDERRNSGEFSNGGAVQWMENKLTEARQAASEHLKGISSDPIFRSRITPAHDEAEWLKSTKSLYEQAHAVEGTARQERRENEAKVMVSAAFKTTTPGDHGSVLAELDAKTSTINSLAVTQDTKNRLLSDLGSSAYQRVVHGIHAGVRAPDTVVRNPLFTTDQQRALADANNAIKTPGIFANTTEAQQSLDQALKVALTPETLQTANHAADFIAGTVNDPAAKRWPYAKIELAAAKDRLLSNNFEALRSGGANLYEQLKNFHAALTTDNGTAEQIYKGFGIEGAKSEDKDRFMADIAAAFAEAKKLIETGRSNEMAERDTRLKPFADSAATEFSSSGVSSDTAQIYVEISKKVQSEMGIPQELQVHVPSHLNRILTETLWSGDTGRGSSMIQNLGDSFGSQSLMSLAESYLRPGDLGKSGSTANTDPKNRQFAAVLAVSAMDHAGRESGRQDLKLTQFTKQWLDDLANYQKNGSTFPRGHEQATRMVFESTAYKNPVNVGEVLSGTQLFQSSSGAQSLKGIASGLYWQGKQNNDMATAFSEAMQQIMASRVYSASSGPVDQERNNEMELAKEGTKMLRALSEVMTVVPSSAAANRRQVYSLVPTSLIREGALSLPVAGGAADVADLSQQIADTLRYVDYYEPSRQWQRGSFADIPIRYTSNVSDFFSPLQRTGTPDTLPLPAHLTVDWANIGGVDPRRQVGSGGENAVRDYFTKPETRFTANSVAFTQYGAWRYNPKTRTMDAYMFPGMTDSDAAPTNFESGPAQPVFYNYGSDRPYGGRPVQLSLDDLRSFNSAYRAKRSLTLLKPATQATTAIAVGVAAKDHIIPVANAVRHSIFGTPKEKPKN